MTFQSSVAANQGFGVVGEEFLNGPRVAQPGIIDSVGTTPSFNRVGRAFTQVSGADGHCIVGGAIGPGTPFYGILANPKVYPALGGATGTLAPTLDLPQYAEAEFIQESAGLNVLLPTACSVGDLVDFDTTTGVLSTRSPSVSATGSITSNVLTVTAVSAGSAPIAVGQLLNGKTGEFTILAILTGTGGVGTYTTSVIADATSGAIIGASTPAAGTANIPRAKVARYNLTGAGVGVISINAP